MKGRGVDEMKSIQRIYLHLGQERTRKRGNEKQAPLNCILGWGGDNNRLTVCPAHFRLGKEGMDRVKQTDQV